MTAVLDVSAGIELLLQKDKKDLFTATYEKASWIIAPDLYIAELSNVLMYYAVLARRNDALLMTNDDQR